MSPSTAPQMASQESLDDILQRTLDTVNEYYNSPYLTDAEADYLMMVTLANIKRICGLTQRSGYENNGSNSANSNLKSVKDWINQTGSAAPVAYAPSLASGSMSVENFNMNNYRMNPRMTRMPQNPNMTQNHHPNRSAAPVAYAPSLASGSIPVENFKMNNYSKVIQNPRMMRMPQNLNMSRNQHNTGNFAPNIYQSFMSGQRGPAKETIDETRLLLPQDRFLPVPF